MDALFELEKTPPFSRSEGVRGAAFEFDETIRIEMEWLRSRLKLLTMRDLAVALGIIGDNAAAMLDFSPTVPVGDLNRFAADRLQALQQIFPGFAKWNLASLPDPLQSELRKKLQRSYDYLALHGQESILARLRQDKLVREDSPKDWKEIAAWLSSPSVRETRELFAFVAALLDPTAEDPVVATAAFLQQSNFELQLKSLTLSIPNNLPQGPLVPGEDLYIFLRPQGGTTARTTLTFHIDRPATIEGVRAKQYRYRLTEGDGVLRFKPRDEFGAELNLKKGDKIWQFVWSNARTASFAFESLKQPPTANAAGASERGTPADGVTLEIEGKFPTVPAMLPDLRREKK